jgi:hypothetical protein
MKFGRGQGTGSKRLELDDIYEKAKKEGKLDSVSIFGGASLPWTSKQANALNNSVKKPTTTGIYPSKSQIIMLQKTQSYVRTLRYSCRCCSKETVCCGIGRAQKEYRQGFLQAAAGGSAREG